MFTVNVCIKAEDCTTQQLVTSLPREYCFIIFIVILSFCINHCRRDSLQKNFTFGYLLLLKGCEVFCYVTVLTLVLGSDIFYKEKAKWWQIEVRT